MNESLPQRFEFVYQSNYIPTFLNTLEKKEMFTQW
jgi:hypothetical protein